MKYDNTIINERAVTKNLSSEVDVPATAKKICKKAGSLVINIAVPKAESLIINSAGQRPAGMNAHKFKPQRGVINLVVNCKTKYHGTIIVESLCTHHI